MKRRILLIDGHPDSNPARLCNALAGAYAEGASTAGHEIRQLDIASLSFPVLRDPQEFTRSPSHPDILAAQGHFLWADHLVFIFPLWLGGPPALLKAFMEILGCGEFLLGSGKGLFPKGRLAGRTARMVVTMGMPSFIYRRHESVRTRHFTHRRNQIRPHHLYRRCGIFRGSLPSLAQHPQTHGEKGAIAL